MFNEKVNLNGTSGRVKLKEIRERMRGVGLGERVKGKKVRVQRAANEIAR